MKEHGICAKCKKSVGCPYADDRIKGCKKFVLEDELELTNEELLRQCTTEQLAEAIYYLTWFHNELDERLDKNVKNGCYNDDENIKIVTEWLKQTHNSPK